MKRAVLWDLDGTLIDSGDFHWHSWRDALAAEGFDLTPERFRATFGMRNAEILRLFFGPNLSDAEIERIAGQKEAAYRAMVRQHGLPMLPGASDWLRQLRHDGWQQSLATSAPRINVLVILEVLGLEQAFDALACAEDVSRGKPDPQVFLVAAERLGVLPPACIVVEDSPAGIEAAKRAGMRCIGVPSGHGTLAADLVVERLDQLSITDFQALIQAQ